ncbi:MAG: ABC transporter substrate-binding protein [Treponema sp.]|jgi:lactose/L-arabinose transport system substrate-binding protein|nr:ABC transporter substrate-binding protein [Treponema sp.]
MKRSIAILFILVLSGAAVFAGGGRQNAAPADPNAPVNLTVWCWDPNYNIYAIKEAEKIYKKDHPNVSVTVVETSLHDIQQKLITAFTSRQTQTLPDITLIADNDIQKNLQNFPNAFIPVNDKVNISQMAKSTVEVSSYNGKNYTVPFGSGVTGTFLRRDYIEKAGLKVSDFDSITWERFIELGKIVKEKAGVPLISFTPQSLDTLFIMLQGAGQWFFDNQGKAYIKNNPTIRRIIELHKEMVDSGIVLLVTDWNGYIASLNGGTVASTIQGCWIIGSIAAETSQAGKWAMVNTPKFANINSANSSVQGGSGWVVLSSSKYPDVALDFLSKTFAGSVELYDTILPSSGAVSTWLPAINSPAYKQPHPFFGGQKVFEDLGGYLDKVPPVKYGVYNYEARDAVGRAIAEVVLQGASIDSALDTAQREVEFLINQ